MTVEAEKEGTMLEAESDRFYTEKKWRTRNESCLWEEI